MDDLFQQEDERWTQVNENFDLLFARVASIGINQERLESQMNLGNQVMEQMLKDQQILAKQIELTGEAVARITLNRPQPQEPADPPPSPTRSHSSLDRGPHPFRAAASGIPVRPLPQGRRVRREPFDFSGHRHVTPKMSCPTFDGSNPRILKSKCLDYFELCNIDEAFWPMAASISEYGWQGS